MNNNRPIVICADNDDPCKAHPNAGGTGVAKARDAVFSIENSYLAVCPRIDGEKADFNDLARTTGHEVVKAALIIARCKMISDKS